MENLEKAFSEFNKTALRIEALPEYHIEGGEWEEYEKYRKGLPIQGYSNQEWIDQLETWRKEGKTISRIRIVPEALNDYLRYEIKWCFPINWDAGEDIKIVGQNEYESHISSSTKGDYWIFDNDLVLQMNYDDKGKFIIAELNEDQFRSKKIIELSNRLGNISIPYMEYTKILR